MSEYITTYSGIQFYPLNPRVEDINIVDVAHHLSNICRFTGACREFYSVAQHSIYVSQMCDPEHALRGLLHDATEAYLSDIAGPVKHADGFSFYREAEKVLDMAICTKFGLPHEMHESVKTADKRVFATEVRDLMPSNSVLTDEPYTWHIYPQQPTEAESLFLDYFHTIRFLYPARKYT